jgi:hypothetical protein
MAEVETLTHGNFAGNSIYFQPAVTRGLLGLYFLGGTLAGSVKNQYGTAPALGTVGTPAINAGGYASLTPNVNYFTTGIPDQTVGTLLAVARATDAMTGNYGTPLITAYGVSAAQNAAQAFGTALGYSASGTYPQASLRGGMGTNSGSVITQTAAGVDVVTNASTFKFLGATFPGTNTAGTITEYNQTDATIGTSAYTGTPTANAIEQFLIGSSASGAVFQGTADMGFAAIYNDALTQSEIAAMYAQIKLQLSALYPSTYGAL